ncbi:sporulation related protein [Gemmobacter caeni]|uniref:Sporulation related protein n=1 Tax=Gemmobacter caeni TaxID=589035 RepID=A0A2T6BBQ6_9RHOB|nr:trypsin-like peptidase domain-containing protein [Gemmobacter caeni]PTX53498.1 sporulation related protein [Gemmobacter caeni]TWJ05609.1 sporulation related protein [Gemmobacter caeni]
MRHILYLLGLVVLLALPQGARAQQQYWLQIEAQPTLREAEDRARAWSALFPDVAGFTLGAGWYALTLGPHLDRDSAQERLVQLKREGLIPRDSYVTDNRALREPFWPTGMNLAPAPAEPEAQPVTVPEVQTLALPDAGTGTDPAPAPEPEAQAAPPEPSPPAIIEESPAEARASEALLSRDQRMELQAALQWYGFYNASIDGAFGPGTRKSMADWQTANGLEPTGILTTMQRDTLVAAHQQAQAELGLQTVTEQEAGIEITLPTALVEFDHYEPPFAHFREKNGSGVRVILISEPGDQSTLYGLYDVLQTLEVVPLSGERSRAERSFTIDGRNGTVASHTYAELSKGLIKGYMLIWNPAQDERMGRVLAAMQSSFRSVGDKALDPGLVPLSDDSRRSLMAGLEVRRPELSRTGFYVDGSGAVLTTREAVEGCNRITLDLRTDATVTFSDAATGLALLKPAQQLSPPAVAELLTGPARPGQEVAVSGYSYEDTLPAPTLTFGTLEEMKGLDGEAGIARLSLQSLPGDAGGPVLDGAGTVIGMLMPRDTAGSRKLPDSVTYAAQAATIATRLTEAGITPHASARSGAMAPEDLSRMARGMTVLVSCW